MNLYILFGQTASGKTKKAFELVKQQNGEIVNFDSRQMYKKLDIVTGKDSPDDSSIRIWLYDIVDPKDTFSSAEYCTIAEKTIKDILARGKTPILVGGTGYYLRHLVYGVPELNTPVDWALRKELEKKSVQELQTILAKKNEVMLCVMNNSDRNNPRRLIRRIEITESGTVLLPVSQDETLRIRLGYSDLKLTYLSFFHSTKEGLIEKIAQRVDRRILDGAFEEVKALLKDGYTKNDPGLNAIGYSQIIRYLDKELTLSETKKQWITREVQYAKRQKTYFTKYFLKK